jgi:hypothetical protein
MKPSRMRAEAPYLLVVVMYKSPKDALVSSFVCPWVSNRQLNGGSNRLDYLTMPLNHPAHVDRGA